MFQNPQIMCLLTSHAILLPDCSLVTDENWLGWCGCFDFVITFTATTSQECLWSFSFCRKHWDFYVLYFIVYLNVLTVYFSTFKVLDAPELQDDYYHNLLNWGSQNIRCGVGQLILNGLGTCTLPEIDNYVTSVA
jgi:hypothetical protein